MITLSGLVATTPDQACWLPHSEALLTAGEFATEADWLRRDAEGQGARTPYSLYFSVQLRLAMERCCCVVGFTRGLAHFGWPEFEIEDAVAAAPAATLYKTLVNAAIHRLRSKAALNVDETIITSAGFVRIDAVGPSQNFAGEALQLRFEP